MGRRLYTKEQIEWLRQFAKGRWLSEIKPEFEKLVGFEISQSAMRSLMKNHHISSKVKGLHRPMDVPNRMTTVEQDEIIRNKFHEKGGSYRDVQKFMREEFGKELSLLKVKGYLSRHKIRFGHYGRFQKGHVSHNKGKKMTPEAYELCKGTMFKKGNIPSNHRPVGSERITRDGYTEIKIAEPNKWMLKSRYLWEQATGETLTKNDKIVFLDHNPMNLSLDNLAKVKSSELSVLNRHHLIGINPDASKVGITIARLLIAKKSRRKK